MSSPLASITRKPSCTRSEEHTSELQSLTNLVCRLLLEKKNDDLEAAGAGEAQRAAPLRPAGLRPEARGRRQGRSRRLGARDELLPHHAQHPGPGVCART